MTKYLYSGDRFTRSELKGQTCQAVKKPNGKCIRGHNSNILVEFDGIKVVILARRLRKL